MTAEEIFRKWFPAHEQISGDASKCILAAMEEYRNQPTPGEQQLFHFVKADKDNLPMGADGERKCVLLEGKQTHLIYFNELWYLGFIGGYEPIKDNEWWRVEFLEPVPASLQGFSREQISEAYKTGYRRGWDELQPGEPADPGLDDYLAFVSPEQKGDGWMPIESAPKGKDFLVLFDTGEIMRYEEEYLPPAEIVKWHPLPEKPII